MKKLLPSLLALSSTFLFVFPALAETTCGLENNEQFSSGGIKTPAFVTSGANWAGVFDITNTSEVPITVRMAFTDVNGLEYTPYSLVYYHNFDATNTPINPEYGATLQPGAMGTIVIKDDNTNRVNVGKLSWSANACINEAVMATMFNQYNHSNRYDSGWVPLNNGKPF